MTTLADLGLTPSQYAEVERCDDDLVQAWLEQLDHNRSTIKKPVGWFLAAIRTGQKPSTAAPTNDLRTAQQIRNAEAWIRNVGHQFTLEDEHLVEAHLFDDRGVIRNCTDEQLKHRLLKMWRTTIPPTVTEPEGSPRTRDSRPFGSVTAAIPEDAGPPNTDDIPF